jgi:alpha-L-rhamnosidase
MALSTAHRRSRAARIDPCYSATRVLPEPDRRAGPPWLYLPGALEAWRMVQVRANGFRDATGPFHPGTFVPPATVAWFRAPVAKARGRTVLELRTNAAVAVNVGGRPVFHHPGSDAALRCDLTPWLDRETTVGLTLATTGEPPTVRVLGRLAGLAWSGTSDGFRYGPVSCEPATRSGLPPHRVDEPVVELAPVAVDGDVADFGRELLARVVAPRGRGLLTVGESLTEVRHPQGIAHEQHLGLVDGGRTRTSAAALALRYVRVTGADPAALRVRASFHPVRYRGAFACSDPRLDAIWMRSAYTLRLCMQDFLVDGLKRDRMPWVGDLALSVMANAYTFAEDGIVRRTLTGLHSGGIAASHLNGIVDYTLWWPIALQLQRWYSGRSDDGCASAARLRDLLDQLERRCGADGLLRAAPGDWVFIDWVDMRKDGVVTAVQVLWAWALDAIAGLAGQAADEVTRRRARSLARRVRLALRRAWGPTGYRMLVDQASPVCRHATLLATLGEVLPRSGRSVARGTLAGESALAVGTPFMGALQAAALGRLGGAATALAQIRSAWGGMLDLGATAFWEAFDPAQQGDQHLAYYGRPFGKSLCHAWGSGPAALLPEVLLGIRPLAPGWTRIAVGPQLCGLAWAATTVPTPLGDLEVEARADGGMTMSVPAGAVVEHGGRTWRGRVELRSRR